MSVDFLLYSKNLVGDLASRHSMQILKYDKSEMGEWYVYFESTEFILYVWQDRNNNIDIEIGSKIRHKPKAHLRGPWSSGHLKGYLDGSKDHYKFKSINEAISWLTKNEAKIFDNTFLNSDELSKWAVNASHRLFNKKTN